MKPTTLPKDILDGLSALFAIAPGAAADDSAFDALARRIFEFQYANNAPYSAYCERRERTPRTIGHWTRIPAVPTAAFREAQLVAGAASDAQALFRTSGTTHGRERRGVHHVLDLSLYHEALLSHFQAMVLPDRVRPVFLSIVPPPGDLPDSSLAHMIAVLIGAFGGARSGWHASSDGGIDEEAVDRSIRTATAEGMPVCILGTSFSFIHWLDALRARGRTYRLHAGSRIMDTGGFKGRAREVGEDEMRTAYEESLGVPPSHCVNEYGMTEMCSQFYDSSLRDLIDGRAGRERRKVGPAWVRTRVVHPDTLEPVPAGATGILQHFDLANAGSVCAIQTEDAGRLVEDGFELLGRVQGAAPRGCSIAMDDLLGAIAARSG